jgi:hypothetical protein
MGKVIELNAILPIEILEGKSVDIKINIIFLSKNLVDDIKSNIFAP